MSVVGFHPEAQRELMDSVRFYEDQAQGLGADFLEAVRHAIRSLGQNPEQWPVMEISIRRILLSRFPYGLLYSIESHGVLVVAVMHLRRRPGYWKHRH